MKKIKFLASDKELNGLIRCILNKRRRLEAQLYDAKISSEKEKIDEFKKQLVNVYSIARKFYHIFEEKKTNKF